MIDASYIKVHPHAAGAVGGNQDMGRSFGMPVRVIITDGTVYENGSSDSTEEKSKNSPEI